MKVVFDYWPKTLDEFKDLDFFDLSKAKNTTTLFLIALDLFTYDQEVGVAAINLLKGPIALNPHGISFIKDRLLDKPYLSKSYFNGAKVENDYTPDLPYTIEFYKDERAFDMEEGYMRLFMKSSGADSKRFITLRKKDDFWYIWEYPGVLMDIRKPKSLDPWS